MSYKLLAVIPDGFNKGNGVEAILEGPNDPRFKLVEVEAGVVTGNILWFASRAEVEQLIQVAQQALVEWPS